jgi:hypothetical protein
MFLKAVIKEQKLLIVRIVVKTSIMYKKLLLLLSLAVLQVHAQEFKEPVEECTTPARISWLRGFPVPFFTYVSSSGSCEFRLSTNVGRGSRNVFFTFEVRFNPI